MGRLCKVCISPNKFFYDELKDNEFTCKQIYLENKHKNWTFQNIYNILNSSGVRKPKWKKNKLREKWQ